MTPKWYQIAMEELGVTEGPGSENNPRVLEYHKQTGLAASQDAVPWCGSFVAWALMKAGIPYRKATAARARDWLLWGKELKEPIIGAVGVIPRGTDGKSGHVFFFAGWANKEKTRFKALGGNQGGGKVSGHNGAVTITTFNTHQVLGWRWPEKVALPVAAQPLRKSGVIGGSSGVLVTGGALVAANAPELVQAVQTAANPPSIVEKIHENAPILVDAVEKSESLRASGTIIGVAVGFLLIALAVWIIASRINGQRTERANSAE